MRLTWIGHSSMLVETDGVRVVADPLLRRRTGALRRCLEPVDVDGLGLTPADELDAVLISHLHHDHCDLPTLRALRFRHLVVPPGSAPWFAAHRLPGAVELAPGERLDVGPGVSVTAVPAEHLGRREPWGPTASSVGHLVEGTAATAWLAGDTGLYEGMSGLPALSRRGVVDVAAIPVWGWGPNLGPGHLDPLRATEAVDRVGARLAVPVHWGTFHPAYLSRTMRRQLSTPGPHFAAAMDLTPSPATAHLLDAGATLALSGGTSSS